MLLDIVEDPTVYLTALKPVMYTGPMGEPYASKQVSEGEGGGVQK